MRTPELCRNCVDFETGICAMQDSAVSIRAKARLIGGYALVPVRFVFNWEPTDHLPTLREPFTNAHEDIAACIRAHRPDVVPLTDWPHQWGSRRGAPSIERELR